MPARNIWKGFMSFGLVTVPVKAYSASDAGASDVKMNQIHKGCNQRVKYMKVCPEHGELRADEIVSGYEFASGQYVLFDPGELEKLRSAKDKSLNIIHFIKPDDVDPVYHSGSTYYLVPDGPVAYKPFTLLHKVMSAEGRWAFARVTLREREQIVLLRPMGKLLAMTFLNYAERVKNFHDFEKEVATVEPTPQEMSLAKTLADALAAGEFEFSAFKDRYKEEARKLIDAKVAGQEVIAPPQDAPVEVINLMEALQRSVADAKGGGSAKPAKLAAPSTAAKREQGRKRKSS